MNFLMKNFVCIILLIVLAGPAGATSIDSGLVAHYPFDGNAQNKLMNKWHGTVSGATLTKDRFDNLNSAYLFDGVNDYIEMLNSDSMITGTFSISCWVFIDDTMKSQNVVGKAADHTGNYKDYQDWAFATNVNGELSAHVTSKLGVPYSAKAVLDTSCETRKWLHIVMTWDTDTLKVYLDGNLTGKTVSLYDFDLSYRFNLSVGGSSLLSTIKPDRFLKGMVDDIRIYNIEIGDDVVDDLYKQGVSGVEEIPAGNSTGINVFPNPSSGYFSIESDLEIVQVQLFDNLGRLAKTFTDTRPGAIYQYQLPKGIYFVQIRTGWGMLVEKLMVE